MTLEKQDKTLELSKHWSPDSIPARNEVIMKKTSSKSVKCDNKLSTSYLKMPNSFCYEELDQLITQPGGPD